MALIPTVSKGKFKAKALEYFRQVEASGAALVITDNGKPVLKIIPFADTRADQLAGLRNTVLKYDEPLAPVALDDWQALR